MNSFDKIKAYLSSYDGPDVHIMEVCGTHTASIAKNGIPAMLSPHIRLISGPGCPVCVTVTDYIDRLIALSQNEKNVICSFGDLLRVPGSESSLSLARADGAHIEMVYSPVQMLDKARRDPDHDYIFAAVGFETTAPVYALLIDEAERLGIPNVKLLTGLKTMPQVIRWVVSSAKSAGETTEREDKSDEGRIDGFLAPGHVCAVTGYGEYEKLAAETGMPFVVSGFTGPQLIASIFRLVQLRGKDTCENLYPEVVSRSGNAPAKGAVKKYFEPCDAAWRGMGIIPMSGLCLRQEYMHRDAGSFGLTGDHAGRGCRCASVLTGKIRPTECPLFGKACTPQNPNGACMVSQEGSCYNWYVGGRTR